MNDSNNDLVVEIVAGANAIESRNAINKQGGAVTYYNQPAYAHLGDAFPVKIKIPIDGPAMAYPVGFFKIALSSFRVGRFGDLEINPFNLSLIQFRKEGK